MKIIGHGGAKGLAPPNSLAAFDKALEYDVDEIECDVRVTSDGQAVLIHDGRFADAAGQRLTVQHVTLAELRQHKPDIITLAQAIDHLDRQRPLYIEVKRRVATQPVIDTLRTYLKNGWQPSDFRLGSYDLAVLRSLHAALPEIQKIIVEDWSSWRAARRAKEFNTTRISMLEYWLWPGFISAMKHRGYELYCFHTFHYKRPFLERLYEKLHLIGFANNPARARRWAKHGLAGVITDYPDLYRSDTLN